MKTKNIVLLNIIISSLIFTSYVYSDNYVFRQLSFGAKASLESSIPSIPETPPSEQNDWVLFAENRNIPYYEDWREISWQGKAISYLPNSPYPNNNLSGDIRLGTNMLNEIDSLSNIISIGGDLQLVQNPLSNLNGLSNLTYVGGDLELYAMTVPNLYPLSNVRVGGLIKIGPYYGIKLPSDSVFCLENENNQFYYTTKSDLCEESSDPLQAWVNFAEDRDLPYGDWLNLDWSGRVIQELPEERYPIDVLTGSLLLQGNRFSHVNSLNGIEEIGGNLYFYSNPNLINLDGLLSINYVGGNLHLFSIGTLSSIDGLRNMNIGGEIRIRYSGTRLPADSVFCSENSESQFHIAYARKSNLCF